MKEIISYGQFPIKELRPHKNKGMEITFVEKGIMEWMVEGRAEKVEPGSVYFTLPWQVHGSMLPKEPDNLVWHVLFHLELDYSDPQPLFGFTEDMGFSSEETRILSSTLASSVQHCFRATPAMRYLMSALVAELQSEHLLRDAHARTLLRAVLVELKRIVTGKALDEETHSLSERKVQELITDFSSNCSHNWNLQSMAEYCGIQRTQLGKIFKKLTNCTPSEYLFRIRMERAKTLLRRTNLKIIDIAFECGYSSSQYFTNTFRQANGVTPSDYRLSVVGMQAGGSTDWKDVEFRSEEEELERIAVFSKKNSK
jgi:AraC family L-rhamnose operon regulatory protein RhaS